MRKLWKSILQKRRNDLSFCRVIVYSYRDTRLFVKTIVKVNEYR